MTSETATPPPHPCFRVRGSPAWRAILLLLLGLPACAVLPTRPEARPLVPTKVQQRVGPFLLYTFEDAPAGAAEQLAALERRIRETLGLRVDPSEPPIEIYILDDEEAFSTFLKFHHPELPPRRAFFLARGDQRIIYTALGERLAEDLRHEATHALLHAGFGRVPLWLDEGLAEYFEAPPEDQRARAMRLLEELVAGRVPDLRRLETLRDVRAMSPGDYREAWAWTHYLLHGPPTARQALLSYLGELRGPGSPTPMSGRLGVDAAGLRAGFVAHLQRVGHPPTRALARFQDADEPVTVLVPVRPAPRTGPIGRFFERIGDALEGIRLSPSRPPAPDRSWPPG